MGTVEAQRGRQTPYSYRAGKNPLITRYVCKNCNTGWMSDLENRVKPIIERFFFDDEVSLERCSQTTLAIWICKNAMVYETLRHKTPWFYTSQERKSIRELYLLPPLTSIWIAKCVGYTGLYCSASDMSGNVVETLNTAKGFVTTMGFGPIAIQILNTKLSKSISQNITITPNLQPGPWDQITIQIWPIGADIVTWPNEIGLKGKHGLENFNQRWKPI
jgi:hypothetical protein